MFNKKPSAFWEGLGCTLSRQGRSDASAMALLKISLRIYFISWIGLFIDAAFNLKA